jgi:hypothetical protein
MGKLLVVVCAILTVVAASAASPASERTSSSTNPLSLRERALGLVDQDREVRPTGQCIATCDDRLVTLKRCPDGECPDYDCRSGYVNCGSR